MPDFARHLSLCLAMPALMLVAAAGCSSQSPIAGAYHHDELPCCAHAFTPRPLMYTVAPDHHIEPVQQTIEGWTVHVDPALLEGEHAEMGERALSMLANHLERITILLPEKQLAQLQELEIWIEHRHPALGNMQYHPSKRWLEGNGYDPRLAKKVHIPRAEALLSRGQMLKHPAVILHELAHAYHDQVLDFNEPRIKAAYDRVMKAGLYDKVMLYDGRQVRHYATTNHKEFFAEATEAYFYRNDFYPFVQGELKQHDRETFVLMEEIWGPLR